MKILLISIVLVFLSGCTGEAPATENAKENIICMQGVKYYKFSESGYNRGRGFLAPVFNRYTKQVEICK